MSTVNQLLGLQQEDLEWYQMVLRCVIVFFLAMAFLRLTRMRSFKSGSAFDMVLNITLGAILARSITGKVPFIPCLCAAATLVLCHQLLALGSFRSARIRQLAQGNEVILYNDGEFNEKDLKKYNITRWDIQQALHSENLDDISSVKSLVFEVNGKINVIKKEEEAYVTMEHTGKG